MNKINCWEHKKCGLHPEACKTCVCPASVHKPLNGIHGGKNAGRACWVIDDSMCSDIIREISTKKFSGCWKCDFYHLVRNEERSSRDGFIETYREMIKVLENRQ